MQCMYIWVDNYRNFVRQGFNFGGPLRFHFDEELRKLVIQPSPFHIEDFFVPSQVEGNERPTSKITNITAIIGENGTGKSSLLEYMINFLNSFREKSAYRLIVFRIERDRYIVYHSPYLEFDIINPSNVEISKEPLTENVMAQLPLAVYFTNIVDARRMPDSRMFIDISTNRLMEQYFDNEDEQRSFGGFYMEETERQLRFIKSRKNKHVNKISFKLPEEIKVIINQPETLTAMKSRQTALRNNFSEFISDCVTELTSYYKDNQIPKKLRYNMAMRVLNHLLQERSFYRRNEKLEILDRISIKVETYFLHKENSIQLEGHALLRAKLSLLVELTHEEMKANEELYRILSNSHKLLDLVEEMDSRTLNNEDSFELPVTNANSTLEKFIGLYHSSIRHDNYLQFKWPGLSSGELSLLNLYTRFYRIRNSVARLSGKSVLILIDEGETLFHPQWQKQLVSNLVTFLSDVFQDKEIQIVLTSNSPFIASDLPKTNVIFLKNADGRTVNIQELDDQHQTFAANIHTLLAHSFFLNDGLIGTFARQKINDVIDLLVNHETDKIMARKQEVEAIISIIGEPLIRSKLMQLLQEKIILKGLTLEDRVAALEARLSQLGGESQ